MTNNYQVSLNATTGATLSYDSNGNMTSDGTNSYAYDAENRLIKITYPGSGNYTSLAYDGLGQKVLMQEYESSSLSATKQLVYSGGGMLEQRDASGAIVRQFFTFGENFSGTSYLFSRDHLGSIREVTNSSGVVESQYGYDPFGRVIIAMQNVTPDFQYASYYNHARSGLNFTRTRAYEPAIARWLTRDPSNQERNMMAYVSNPISGTDPSGLVAIWLKPSGMAGYNQLNNDLRQKMKGMCHCGDCLKNSGDVKECDREADEISTALAQAWLLNYHGVNFGGYGEISFIPTIITGVMSDDIGGHLCWQWAEIFQEAIWAVHPKLWIMNRQYALNRDQSGALHEWLQLSLNESSKCQVYIDDGFDTNTLIHDKRPVLDQLYFPSVTK